MYILMIYKACNVLCQIVKNIFCRHHSILHVHVVVVFYIHIWIIKLNKILISFINNTTKTISKAAKYIYFFLLLSYHTEADGSYATFISPFAGFVHVALTAQSQGCIWLWPTTEVPRTLALAGSEQRVRLKSILRAGWWSAGRWFQTAKKVSMIPHDDKEEKAANWHLIYMYIFM